MKQKRTLLAGIFLLIAVLCAGYVIHYYVKLQRQKDLYSEMQSQVASSAGASEAASSAPAVDIPVDFDQLQQECPDIYAWLEIPDTSVSYPILQHPTEDDYYLSHNLDGSQGYPGCIYTQKDNAKDFSDFNTILYGHNMKDGTMFGSLKQYRDPDYLQQHRDIIIYTPTEKRTYRVFAAVVYSDAYLPTEFDMTQPSGKDAFLDAIRDSGTENGQYLDDVDVSSDSSILTLSTCIGSQPHNRYLIEAVYMEEE